MAAPLKAGQACCNQATGSASSLSTSTRNRWPSWAADRTCVSCSNCCLSNRKSLVCTSTTWVLMASISACGDPWARTCPASMMASAWQRSASSM